MSFIQNRSLKSTILWISIPITMLFVFTTGLFSYLLASDQLQQNAFTSISDTVSQTESFLNDKLTDLVTSLTIIDNDADLSDITLRTENPSYNLQPGDFLQLNRVLNRAFPDRSLIDSTLLSYNNDRQAFYRKDDLTELVKISLEPYKLVQATDPASIIHWLTLHADPIVTTFNQNKSGKVISLYKLLGKDMEHIKGIILFNIKDSFFQTILNNPTISNNGYLCLISAEGIISYKKVEDKYGIKDSELQSQILQTTQGSGKITITNEYGKEMLVVYDTLKINKWKIAAVVPKEELFNKVSYIKYLILVLMFILFVIVIFFSNFLANIISKPIIRLTRKINTIQEGNLDIEFREMPQNEIGILNRGVRDMIHRIKQLLTQIENEQEKKRKAELEALQFQIRPHFLYNTLYSIKHLIEMDEKKEASRMVSALSDFFRISISRGSEIIPVSQEIEHINHYFTIQELRYGDSFTFEIEMEPAILDYKIVKLTLQPLIENAIYHGMKNIRTKGHIRIKGFIQDDDCVILIEDNGAGMSAEQLATINASLSDKRTGEEGAGFGISNVHKRLQLNYGMKYGLSYESSPETGTVVIVTFR
ncbi:cache domain-containing sensor histidine kinase [Paenibacillus radicis (ex Xue et al. 2023)]|uniref:Sensor histidine kinase n=1 Tax=Paenibacillus radicis (ex Xue et al. 2023) TaxID=2972489 RepID=A0ABT1YMD7_9BACL|nr:sensor histidine kinase [Paenibacillus radicis (ex Xue et al. 2023)]MCR8634212.1 sensor histidine kinase [Paenibacillus radicis (ex Xue et al. 2023)]